MPFNHYTKLKRLVEQEPDGWYIRQINEPTQAKNFKGELVRFPYYYRVYDHNDVPLKYCKFQQIERFAKALDIPVEALPLID